jgi:hypothetical protein
MTYCLGLIEHPEYLEFQCRLTVVWIDARYGQTISTPGLLSGLMLCAVGWGPCEDGVPGMSQGQSGGEASLVGVRTSTANKGLPRLASPPSSLTPGGHLTLLGL